MCLSAAGAHSDYDDCQLAHGNLPQSDGKTEGTGCLGAVQPVARTIPGFPLHP